MSNRVYPELDIPPRDVDGISTLVDWEQNLRPRSSRRRTGQQTIPPSEEGMDRCQKLPREDRSQTKQRSGWVGQNNIDARRIQCRIGCTQNLIYRPGTWMEYPGGALRLRSTRY